MEASSSHFVIYADDSPGDLQKFATQLERYHAAMTGVLRAENVVPSPSNRVTIYVVASDAQVRRLAGDRSGFVTGVFSPRAGGSLAIVPPVNAVKGDVTWSTFVLLHEYAHFVTFSINAAPLPAWLIEGSAEFFASAKFEDDGAVRLGMPTGFRGWELEHERDVSMNEMFDPAFRASKDPRKYNNFYGKSWLLYHYLFFSKARSGQLTAYMDAVYKGAASLDAARQAFGDLSKLNDELETYRNANSMMTVRMPAAALEIAPVTVRELRPGEAAMMPALIRSKGGVDRKKALELLPEVRRIAVQYPDDPAVLAELAEAEHDAGHPDEAIAAADATLKIDPRRVNAYIQKGYALFDKAGQATDKRAAYAAARAPFLALNQIEHDHPLPLEYFFLSQVVSGSTPDETARAALRRAVELAPFDMSMRMMLATADLRVGERDEAIMNLKTIAYNPHIGERAEPVRKLLERVEGGATFDQLVAEKLVPPLGIDEAPK